MTKKLTKPQAEALYFIELDGGLIKTHGQEWPYTTARGRPVNALTAKWLIDHDHLLAHDDGLLEGGAQSWEVKTKTGVVRRDDAA